MHRVHLRRRPGRRTYEAYFTLEGRRVFKALGTDDRRLAEDLVAELEFKLRRRELHLPRPIPVETALEAYLAYQRGRRAAKGLKTDEGYLRRALAAMKVEDLQHLSPEKVRAYLAERRAAGRSATTLNRNREVLHTLGSWAVKQGYLAANPISRVERYPQAAPEIKFLRKPEQERLLALFREQDPFLLPLVATCLYAGLRRGEAIWLLAEDVDLGDGLLRVRAKHVGEEGWQPKTRRNRAVPISPALRGILEDAWAPNRNGSPWAFSSPEGCRWDEDNLTHRFISLVRRAGLPWTLLHLRHTFGTMLAMKGIPTFTIANLMGNSELMVRRHYAAFLVDEVREDVAF